MQEFQPTKTICWIVAIITCCERRYYIITHIFSPWRYSYYKFSRVTEDEFYVQGTGNNKKSSIQQLNFDSRHKILSMQSLRLQFLILNFDLQKCVAMLPKRALRQDIRGQHNSFPSQKCKGCQNNMRACARGPLKILIHYKAANNEEKPRFPRVFFAKFFSKLVYFIIQMPNLQYHFLTKFQQGISLV